MSKLVALLINSSLMVVVVLMLSTPLLMGQLLATYETGALGATTDGAVVADAGVAAARFAVYPNVADFAEYARFGEPEEVDGDSYRSTVTFTAFAGQQAAYNALFTIYNTSNYPLEMTLSSGSISGMMDNSRVLMSLVEDGQVGSSLITETAKSDSANLRVGQSPAAFAGPMVVGEDVVEVAAAKSTNIELVEKLQRDVAVGEKVYFSPLYYNQTNQPLLGSTQPISLQPQQKAVVNLTVITDPSEPSTTQMVMPIALSVN